MPLGNKNVKKDTKSTEKKSEVVQEPLVDGFEIDARFIGQQKKLVSTLKSLSFLDVVEYGKGVAGIHVETRTIKKEPYMFSIIYFEKDSIRFLYSIAPGLSPKKRRLEALSYFLNIMTYLGDMYEVSMTEMLQVLQAAIHDMSEYVSLDFEKMYSMHDAQQVLIEKLNQEIKDLRESNEALSRQNYELRVKLEELQVKYEKLKTMSDEALTEKIIEWISEHNGEINIGEFSKVYDVPISRVEEMLNTLVENRFLEPK